MVFIFIFKLLLSLPLGILMVYKNRGQLLDRPEWHVIPGLAIDFVLFTFSFLGSCVFPFFSDDIKKPGFLEAISVLAVITLVIYESWLNELIWNKLILSDKEDNPNSQPDIVKERKEYHKELFGYLSYTLIYISVFFLFFTLFVFLLLNFISAYHLKNIYGLTKTIVKKSIFSWELTGMRLISLVGAGFTLCQMIENFKFSKEKIQKDRISNIKEYLSESSVKN